MSETGKAREPLPGLLAPAPRRASPPAPHHAILAKNVHRPAYPPFPLLLPPQLPAVFALPPVSAASDPGGGYGAKSV